MPRIRWSGLPPALRDHLFDRLRERKITAEDLYQLKTWRESNPDAPEGLRAAAMSGLTGYPEPHELVEHEPRGESRF
jgi:hypothetical protein